MLISIFTFIIGVGVFLYGLTMITSTTIVYAKKLFSFNKNDKFLCPLGAIGISFLATSIIQSSAATNSLSVKLADDGVANMKTALFFIMGSNIGTTTTAYISILARFSLSYIFASFIFIGILLYMVTKNKKLKNIALIICSLSLIFVGLLFINSVSMPFYDKFFDFLQNQHNDFYLFIFAMLLTAILQSSSLTSALLVSLSGVAIINIKTAMFMVMGINVGTCFSVVLASLGSSTKGWVVVFFHFLFNIIGVLINIFMLKTGLLSFLVNYNAKLDIKIALYHTFFNVITTVFLFYFIPEIAVILETFAQKPKLKSFFLSI